MLPAGVAAQVERITRTVMSDQHIAGCSVGIARRGTTLLLKGYGLRDVALRQSADGYTIYRAGSITKQFTAALVMRDVERGRIALQAAAGTYLPSLQPNVAGVTIAELLGQTSGIPSYTDPGATFASAIAAPLQFEPGTSWEYSNTNYALLGRIIEAQARLPYADALDRELLQPLHLQSTAYGTPPFARNVAHGYQFTGNAFVLISDDGPRAQFAGAAGALSTNAVDMLRWLDDLQDGAAVAPASFAAMTHPARLPDGSSTQYGFGFFIHDWYGRRVAEHPGNVDGFSADSAIIPDDGLEVAVLCNADRVSLVPLTQSIVAIVDKPKDANMYADRPRAPENENPDVTAAVRSVFVGLQNGTLDRTLLTPSLAATYTAASLQQTATRLAPLGKLKLVEFIERTERNGVTYEKYRLTCAAARLWMTLGYTGSAKIDAIDFAPDDD